MPAGYKFPCLLTSLEVELPGWGWCWPAGWGSSKEFARARVLSQGHPSLLLLPFMDILCMQLKDGFEAYNRTASPFLWCTYKSVNTIPPNFVR